MTDKVNWRDEPHVIWQDKDGHSLVHDGDVLAVMAVSITGPNSLAERVEMVTRLADTFGLDVAVSERPRPVEVGDLVECAVIEGTYEVRHIDGDQVLIRDSNTNHAYVVGLRNLRHVEAEAHDPEDDVQWVEQGDIPDAEWSEMLAIALDDGRRVEGKAADGWVSTGTSSITLRVWGTGSIRYRMEPPEPEPDVCTEDHRLCNNNGDWCRERDRPGTWTWTCTRPDGHDGPHVACGTSLHNRSSWSDSL